MAIVKTISGIEVTKIEGKRAETLNRMVKEYIRLDYEVTEKTKTLKEMENTIKEMLGAGTLTSSERFETSQIELLLSYTAPSVTFDSTGFKKDHADLYEQYKTKIKKGYVSLTSVKNKTTCSY